MCNCVCICKILFSGTATHELTSPFVKLIDAEYAPFMVQRGADEPVQQDATYEPITKPTFSTSEDQRVPITHRGVSYAFLEAYVKYLKELNRPRANSGQIVHGIRTQKHFLWHEDFKAWLDEHDFVYNERQAHLEQDVWPKFKAFYEENQHLRVPINHPELGSTVNQIRNQKHFLWHEDFRTWLYGHGFEMHIKDERKNRERWEEVLAI